MGLNSKYSISKWGFITKEQWDSVDAKSLRESIMGRGLWLSWPSSTLAEGRPGCQTFWGRRRMRNLIR